MGRAAMVWGLLVLMTAALSLGQGPSSFDDCRRQLDEQPYEKEGAECFYQMARDQGLFQEAALLVEERVERWPDAPWLRFYLANLSDAVDQCRGRAEERYRQAIELFIGQGNRDGEAEARINLVRWLALCVDSTTAIDELPKAWDAAEASTDMLDFWRLKDFHYRILTRAGEDLSPLFPDLERDWLDLKEPIYDNEPGVWRLRSNLLSTLGGICYRMGDYGGARKWYDERRERAREEGDQPTEIMSASDSLMNRLAYGLPKDEKRREILADLRAIRPVAEELAQSDVEARILRLIAKLERGPESVAQLERCRLLADQLNDISLQRECTLALASHRLDDDPDTARQLVSELYAEGLFVSQSPWTLIDGRDDHLRVLWGAFGRQDALAGIERILTDLESLRRPQTGMARMQIVEGWSDTYYWLAGRLLEEAVETGQEPRQAFAVMERLRAQELREVLLYAGGDLPSLPPPPANLLDEIEGTLGDGEAMLTYQLSLWENLYGRFAGGSWVLVSTRDGTRIQRLDMDRVKIEPMVMALGDQTDGQWNEPTLIELYEALLQPALDELPSTIDRLVLNLDGVLHLVPFAALRPAAGRSLGERYEISDTPSADLWLSWKKRAGTDSNSSALVFADPENLGDVATPASTDVRRILPRGDDLGPLRHARREGRRVVQHLRSSSRLMRGSAASEHFLKNADLRSYGLLHFATHAVVDYEKPWLSGVRLTSGDPSEDGWLVPEEIAALDLEGKVIILSTCNSATGRWLRGEGVASLARAFFKAGAHAVVGTLRPLPDDDGELFFNDFYSHLSRGASLRRALAATQASWAARGEPPSTWASVVVQGNGDLTVAPGGIGKLWLLRRWATIFVGLLLTSMLWVRFRRRRNPLATIKKFPGGPHRR